jgi:hypothetical protein
MSQLQMSPSDRFQALMRFGYTEPEASFLCLAGLHGGYFLRRQYAGYLGRQDGGTVSQLIEKTLDRGHAHASTYGNKTQVYHLSARPFYAALGQADNRNRRRHEFPAIKNKLMGLDFVLAHREHHYLATEEEKSTYFTGVLKLPVSKLPVKRYGASVESQTSRYFVDKYPIFLAASAASAPAPAVTFCFVDEGLETLSHFETYLAQYLPLFASLAEFQLTYVATSDAPFRGAEDMFESVVTHSPAHPTGVTSDAIGHQLQEHFEARRLYEAKQFSAFDRQKLIRLRNDLAEFSGDENEVLYQLWKRTGDVAGQRDVPSNIQSHAQTRGTFSFYRLDHRYDFLNALGAMDDQDFKAI